MAFNAKVIEYPNGNIQVRYYSEPVRENFEKLIQLSDGELQSGATAN